MYIDQNECILYLSGKDVKQICQTIDSVAAIRQVFELHAANQTTLPDEAYLSWTNHENEPMRSLNMPGYLGSPLEIAGTKILNSNIGNPARGLPRASGVTLLYDNTTARIVCIMEAAYISSLRTASVTALAADLLGEPDIRCIGIIGAGVLAQAHIELLLKRLPHVERINMFDLDEQRILSLRLTLEATLQKHHVELHISRTAEEAIREAQLIVPATTTTTGYIRYEWLQPGALLVNISLDDPLPEVVFQANKVIVDDWNLVKSDERRLLGRMYRAGQVVGPDDPLPNSVDKCRRIDAQLGEIALGRKVGRQHKDEIILVNPFGLAIEDVALAAQVYAAAQAGELGMQLKR